MRRLREVIYAHGAVDPDAADLFRVLAQRFLF